MPPQSHLAHAPHFTARRRVLMIVVGIGTVIQCRNSSYTTSRSTDGAVMCKGKLPPQSGWAHAPCFTVRKASLYCSVSGHCPPSPSLSSPAHATQAARRGFVCYDKKRSSGSNNDNNNDRRCHNVRKNHSIVLLKNTATVCVLCKQQGEGLFVATGKEQGQKCLHDLGWYGDAESQYLLHNKSGYRLGCRCSIVALVVAVLLLSHHCLPHVRCKQQEEVLFVMTGKEHQWRQR